MFSMEIAFESPSDAAQFQFVLSGVGTLVIMYTATAIFQDWQNALPFPLKASCLDTLITQTNMDTSSACTLCVTYIVSSLLKQPGSQELLSELATYLYIENVMSNVMSLVTFCPKVLVLHHIPNVVYAVGLSVVLLFVPMHFAIGIGIFPINFVSSLAVHILGIILCLSYINKILDNLQARHPAISNTVCLALSAAVIGIAHAMTIVIGKQFTFYWNTTLMCRMFDASVGLLLARASSSLQAGVSACEWFGKISEFVCVFAVLFSLHVVGEPVSDPTCHLIHPKSSCVDALVFVPPRGVLIGVFIVASSWTLQGETLHLDGDDQRVTCNLKRLCTLLCAVMWCQAVNNCIISISLLIMPSDLLSYYSTLLIFVATPLALVGFLRVYSTHAQDAIHGLVESLRTSGQLSSESV